MTLLLLLLGVAIGAVFLLRRNPSNQSRGSWASRLRAALILVGCAVFLMPHAAHALVTPVGPDATSDSLFSLDPFLVTAILGTIIPIAVGIVTKASQSAGLKAVLLTLLSAVAGIINVSTTDGGGAIISEATIKSAVLTFLVAVTTYFGLFKPTGVADQMQAIGNVDKPPAA